LVDKIESLKAEAVDSAVIDDLRSEIKILTEQLADKEKQLERSNHRFTQLSESVKSKRDQESSLNESLSTKDMKIKALNEQLLEEKNLKAQLERDLKESLAEEQKNSAIKAKEYSNKIAKAK
jgi:predicted  nucleic acid-binding Zn-ribbon protein